MRTDYLSFLAVAIATASPSNVQAQTAVETYRFILSGNSSESCDKGSLKNMTDCHIDKSESKIDISYTDYDMDIVWTYESSGKCLYSVTLKRTYNKNSTRYGKTEVAKAIFDFSSFYGVEIKNVRFMNQDGGMSFLDVSLLGVKRAFVDEDNTESIDNGQNIEKKDILIISPSISIGKKRYEDAVQFLKDNFCAGSAF